MFYDRFVELCTKKGVAPTRAAIDAGISKSLVSKWKANEAKDPSPEVARKLASYFNIPVSQLLDSEADDPIVYCDDCGLRYNAHDPEEVMQHSERHIAWQKAVNKFGFCWSPTYREEQKGAAREKIASGVLSDEGYIEAQTIVFKALFSRSLGGCDYSLQHPSFEDYVAMLLNQDQWKKELPPHIYMKLSAKYGIKSGIPAGSYYKTEKAPTLEGERRPSDDEIKFALFGGDGEITDAMYAEVKNFAAYVKQREGEKKKKEEQ